MAEEIIQEVFQGDPVPPKRLTEQNRVRLDSIVQKMIANKESDDDIKFVVNDFKQKYGEVQQITPQQPSFQVQISQPTFMGGRQPATQWQSAPPDEPIKIKKEEIKYIPTAPTPEDEKKIKIDKFTGQAKEAHKQLRNELLANDAQYEKQIREIRKNEYTIERLRADYKAMGYVLPPQDEQRFLQKEKQRQYDLPVTPEDISDIKTGTVTDERFARKFIKDLNKGNVAAKSWMIDKYNEIANDPEGSERINKIKDVEKEIKAGRVIYNPETGQAFKPVGLIGSAIEAVKQKNQLYADRDFLKNTENDAAILSEYKARKKDQQDDPIVIPKGKAAEIVSGIAGTPLKVYAAGILGGFGGPQAGMTAAAIVGGREASKLEYPATFWRTLDELISQGVPDFEAVQKARFQAEQAAEIGFFTGAASGLIGSKIGFGATPKINLSQGFKTAAFNILKQNGYDIGKAGLEGLAAGGVGVAGEMYKNKLAQEAGIKRGIDEGTKEVFEQNLLITVALAAAIKGFRGITWPKARQLMHGLTKLPDDQIGEMLTEKVNNGEITQKAADETQQRINEYKGLDKLIPDDVSEEARFKIQDKITKRGELESQLETTDKAYHPEIKEKIKAIDEEIIGLTKEGKQKIEKPETGLTKEQEKEAAELAEEWLAEGILPDIAEGAIKKDPIGFFKELAQQAQNRDANWNPLKPEDAALSEQAARDNYGDTVVDYAMELFPAPEIKETGISVIMPGEIKQPEIITIKQKEDAIPVRSAEEVPLGETPGYSEKMGARVPEPGETAGTQEGQQIPTEETGVAPSQEGQVGEPEMIGITHAQMDKVSQELGLPTYEQDPESFAGWTREAKDRMKKDPDSINKLINKLRRGETPDPVETQMMKMHFAALKGRYDANPTPELLAEINRTKNLYNISGRQEGKSLVARKGLMPVDENSLSDFHLRDVEFNKGAPLTEQQLAQSTKEFNEIKTVKDALEQKVAKLEADAIKAKAEKKLQQEAKVAKKEIKKDYKAERTSLFDQLKNQKEAHLKKLKDQGIQTMGGGFVLTGDMAKTIAKIVKSYVDEGVNKLEELTKIVHENIKDILDGISEKDIHDVIAGVYDEKKPSRNKAAASLYEMKKEAQLMNELDQLLSGEIPRNENKRRKRNQRIEALRQQIKELKDDMGLNERDMAQKLATLKGKYKSKIKELEEKIAKGDYGPDEKPEPIKLDKEAQDLRDEYLRLKDERAIRLLRQEYANRSTTEKNIARVGKALRTGRQLQSGFFDVSYPFRQTIVGLTRQLLSLPFKRENGKLVYTGFKSQRELRQQFGKMYQAFASEKYYRSTMADIKESPRFDVAQKSKLDIAEVDTPLERFKEEEAQASYAEKIPVAKQAVRMSNRAATVIANKMKFDIFNQLVDGFEQQGKTFENSPDLYKEAAKYANQLVGRGFLGQKIEMASPLIGHVVYSLRLQASRLQLLTNIVNPRFYAKVPKEIRVEYFKDMAKFVFMGTAMLGLAKAAGFGVELDPRSSDFGTIRWGDTRIDIWGGFKQYVTLFSRLFTASTKSPETGKVSSLKLPFSAGKPKHGEKTYGDLLLRFARTKASPEAGTVSDILIGETFDKKAVTAQGEAVRYIAPMIIGDVYDAWKDNGVLGAALTYLLATHGVGVQTHLKEDDFDTVVERAITGDSQEESPKSKSTLHKNPRGKTRTNPHKNKIR